MKEYPKTENLLRRDEETHKLIPGAYREEAFEQVGRWHVTEKIDGTNIRLVLDTDFTRPYLYTVRGRSDKANLPKNFEEEAVPDIDADRMLAALRAIDPDEYATAMCIYGEGYGPGIQKGGGDLAERKSFRIFDVVTIAPEREPLWRRWAEVEAVAEVLGLQTVPVLGTDWTMTQVEEYVANDPYSLVAATERKVRAYTPMEGIVARTDPYLYTSRGNRVKFKLKGRDLATTVAEALGSGSTV